MFVMEPIVEELSDLDDIRSLCRFCLKPNPDMRELHPDELRASDIPVLFANVTSLELVISTEYSALLCAQCEAQLRSVHQIQNEFRRIDSLWKTILVHRRAKSSGDGSDECEMVELEVERLGTIDCGSSKIAEITESEVGGQLDHTNNVGQYYDELPDGDDDIVGNEVSTETDEDTPRDNYESNNTLHGTNVIFICDICGDNFGIKRLLLNHMADKHSKSSKNSTCHICGKTNLKRLAQHLRDHRKTDKFKCTFCPKSFNRRTLLRQHERLHTGERPFICEVCAFAFTSSAALKRHCKSHSMENDQSDGPPKHQAQRLRVNPTRPIPKLPPRQGVRLQCPLCHNTYVNRASLQPHMKLMHGADGLAAWKQMLDTTCLVCNEKFECAEDLAKHKPVHIEYQCTICRRRFHCKITLDLHVKNHSTKERNYQCEICEASYLCAFTLKNHIRRAHTTERPFQCTICQSGFVERWELNTHMRKTHSFQKTLKPHQCPLCPESFKSKDALRSHTEKHTGQYRYWCEPCNRNLHSGPLLAEHERSYHPERRSIV